jgi:hypothetical protein
MIENALFSRVREKACLNGVQMEYGNFRSAKKDWQTMIAGGISGMIKKWQSS